MGSMAQPLLQALGVAPPSPVGEVPPAPPGYDGPDYMSGGGLGGGTEAVMGFPSVMREGIAETGALPGAPMGGGQAEDVAAVVQGFKPKRISFWGALGDQLLKHWGSEPHFQKDIDAKNMRRAMEGFTQDPMEAIRRISQIPGMEAKAWDLMNQLQDNQRMQGTLDRQNRSLDLQNERILYDRVAGMMGAADASTWGKMRDTAIKIGQARGVDVGYLIPEEYDPDAIEYIRFGAVKPKDQMTLEERRANNEARIGLGRDRLEETTRHNYATEGQAAANEQGRRDRAATPRPKAVAQGPAQSIRPDGSRIIYGGPDKRTAQTAVVILPTGEKRHLNKLPNGKWMIVAPPKKEGN